MASTGCWLSLFLSEFLNTFGLTNLNKSGIMDTFIADDRSA